jgi:hypothetical protein
MHDEVVLVLVVSLIQIEVAFVLSVIHRSQGQVEAVSSSMWRFPGLHEDILHVS